MLFQFCDETPDSSCFGCSPSYPCFSMKLYRDGFPICNFYFSAVKQMYSYKEKRNLSKIKIKSGYTQGTAVTVAVLFHTGMFVLFLQKATMNAEDRWVKQGCITPAYNQVYNQLCLQSKAKSQQLLGFVGIYNLKNTSVPAVCTD